MDTVEAAVASIDESTLQPLIRKSADEFYGQIMEAVQDYLKDNAAFNIGSEVSMLRRTVSEQRSLIEAKNRALRRQHEAWSNALELGVVLPQHRMSASILATEAHNAWKDIPEPPEAA